ncbi:D-alanyl-D-alanine carboxypeptidase [Streptomyces argyrophylli]|uniref:D-alanyl-D-alanine carboxypeptidase n=1 Tax=Streptomyces argyrophylli TaxID=2726118 RepID=UPI002017FE7D|nr:D-alanyl-D-alanine carboxypeptidase [Streptomyces argyrophyllae]
MEEASVAGESPDRSKQRESSAEPTSGSAGSVPEARDPRLAVSRERKSSGGDTATKVLTVRPETPAAREESADPEDTALQAAVSAWVREPSPETPANADDTAEKAPKTEADASSRTEAEPEEPSDADGDADADGEADRETEAEDADAAKAEADTPSETRTKAETKDTTDAEPAEDQEADAKADAEPAEDEDADAEADADAEDKASGEGEAPAAADGDGNEPEAADGEDAPQGPPAADDETRTGGAGGNEDGEGEAEADPRPQPPQAPRADGDEDAEGEAEPADADGPRRDPADKDTGVDQPTTVFKAVRPKTPPVDQPTTMLKLGGKPQGRPQGKPEAKPEDKPEAKPKTPESDPERTSKFVALKDDLRKPAAQAKAPDATTPVPQVGPERTTQQPLPPKPPLDLLAELTNTPPPPETPVRTLVRRIKIWTPLVLLLAIIFAVVQAVRPLPAPTLALTGKDSYTFAGDRTQLPWPGEGQGWMDVDGVGTMGHFGKQTPVAIGSVAKTMTAYIILKDHPLKPGQEGPKIKVDPTAEKEGGYNKAGESTLDTVKAGESLTEKQALSAVLIPSANNIARLLARWDAGSEAAFVKKMNATARELGMTRTTYTDPSGLKETTVSTAEDQVKLGRAFVKVPALVAISSAASWTDPSGKFWPNYNELPYRIGAIGIKTGSTTAAGGNLLFASRKQVGGQTVTLVGAILGQHKREILQTVNTVSKTALLAAQSALTSAKIVKKGDVVGYVDDRLGGRTPVVVTKDVTAAGWAGMKVKLSFASGTVPHTAKAGTRVGTLTVGDGSAGAVKVPVALREDLAEPGMGARLTRLG